MLQRETQRHKLLAFEGRLYMTHRIILTEPLFMTGCSITYDRLRHYVWPAAALLMADCSIISGRLRHYLWHDQLWMEQTRERRRAARVRLCEGRSMMTFGLQAGSVPPWI